VKPAQTLVISVSTFLVISEVQVLLFLHPFLSILSEVKSHRRLVIVVLSYQCTHSAVRSFFISLLNQYIPLI